VEEYYSTRQATDNSMIRRMRFACRIPKATKTLSEYVTGNVFPRQKLLRESSSMLRYTYIVCLAEKIVKLYLSHINYKVS
jgi:hypothetical protein